MMTEQVMAWNIIMINQPNWYGGKNKDWYQVAINFGVHADTHMLRM